MEFDNTVHTQLNILIAIAVVFVTCNEAVINEILPMWRKTLNNQSIIIIINAVISSEVTYRHNGICVVLWEIFAIQEIYTLLVVRYVFPVAIGPTEPHRNHVICLEGHCM